MNNHCPDCRVDHEEPADARLGHRVLCLDCAMAADILLEQFAAMREIAIAA